MNVKCIIIRTNQTWIRCSNYVEHVQRTGTYSIIEKTKRVPRIARCSCTHQFSKFPFGRNSWSNWHLFCSVRSIPICMFLFGCRVSCFLYFIRKWWKSFCFFNLFTHSNCCAFAKLAKHTQERKKLFLVPIYRSKNKMVCCVHAWIPATFHIIITIVIIAVDVIAFITARLL